MLSNISPMIFPLSSISRIIVVFLGIFSLSLVSFNAFAQMSEPGNGEEGEGCDEIRLRVESQDCSTAVLKAYPDSGCSFDYTLYRNDVIYDSDSGEVVFFTVPYNGRYKIKATKNTETYDSQEVEVSSIETAVNVPSFDGSISREICPNSSTELKTTTSQSGVQYSLMKGDEKLAVKDGTGSAVSFGQYKVAGTYKIKAEKTGTQNGCKSNSATSSELTLTVKSFTAPQISVSNQTPCPEESVKLSTNFSAVKYYWYKNGEIHLETNTSETRVSESGSYSVKVDTDCSGYQVPSDPVEVTYQETKEVSVNLSADKQVVCENEEVTFTASVTNGGASPSYYWTVNGVEWVKQGGASITISAANYSGSLRVSCKINTNATGCFTGEATQTVSEEVDIEPSIDAPSFTIGGTSVEFCPNGSIELKTVSSESGVSYKLYRGATPLATKEGTGAAIGFGSYEVEGDYQIKAEKITPRRSCAGNSAESSVLKVLKKSYEVPVTVSNEIPCPGESVTLSTTFLSDKYFWYKGDELLEEKGEKNQSITVNKSGNYTLRVGTDCIDYLAPGNTVSVTYQELKEVTLSIASDDAVCYGEEITFTASPTNGGTNPSYYWVVNGVEWVKQGEASITVSATNYEVDKLEVRCTLTSNASGCFVEKTVSSTKTVAIMRPTNTEALRTSADECIRPADAFIRIFSSRTDVEYALYKGAEAVSAFTKGNGGELVFAIPAAGTYRIGARSVNGCGPVNFSQEYTLGTPRTVTIQTAFSLNQCEGSEVSLTAAGTDNILSYVWYNSKNEVVQTAETVSVRLDAGNHRFRLVGRTGEGCTVKDEISFDIAAADKLPADPRFTLEANGQLQLHMNNTNSGENTYYWQEDRDGTSTALADESRIISEPGYYYVRALNSNGCWGRAVHVYVPDFSTPQYAGTGLSQDRINYVRTHTYQEAGLPEEVSELCLSQVQETTVYFDGLGRQLQEVAKGASPTEKDLVTPVLYDAFGRNERSFAAFAADAGTGTVVAQPFVEQDNFYQTADKVAHDGFPFSTSLFEPSPMNRVVEQGAPGLAWQPGTSHTLKNGYSLNAVDDRIIAWKYVPAANKFGEVVTDGYYQNNQLFISETEDEEGELVKEYTDKLGQVVLKEVLDEEVPHYTYYVYDDFGQLRAVLPPAFMDAWKAAGGSVHDPVDYEGYKVIQEDFVLNDISEGTKFYVRRGVAFTMPVGFNSGGDFHVFWEGEPQPAAAAVLNDFAFFYHYDERQRMVEKYVPGGGLTYMVYDPWDRLVLTQDAEQRETHQWLYTKYDGLNRPVVTGLWQDADGRERADLQQAIADGVAAEAFARSEDRDNSQAHGYSLDKSFPPSDAADEVLTVSFYDNYNFKFSPAEAKTIAEEKEGPYSYTVPEGFEYKRFNRIQGQVTGTKTRVLGTDSWLKTVSYYDDKYRLIQSVTDNQQGGTDRFSSAYDFTGKVMHSLLQHTGKAEVTIRKEFVYDHAGRLLQTWQTIGESEENKTLLAENEYNALGELVDKKLHSEDEGESFLQSVDYRYNIRGWLTSINNSSLAVDEANDDADDFFGMELGYTHDFGLGAEKVNHNGNITAIKWSANLGLDATENQRAYTYSYDGLNRIAGAAYKKRGAAWAAQEAYRLSGISYDKNGNIKSLSRNGADGGAIDILNYAYEKGGNQLTGVSDVSENEAGFKDGGNPGDDYAYDLKGNLTEDKNKGISEIRYNHLNLPVEVIFTDGNKITYTYDAAGIKLSQLVEKEGEDPKLTEYIGGMVYENGELQFIQHEEGRVVLKSGEENSLEYQYHLKDHLGNVRMSFTSRDKVEEATATMETVHEEEEWSQFLHYEEVTKINTELFDYTDEGGTYYSMRLSGVEGEQIGLAKTLAVNPGDVVSAQVFAKYLDPNQDNWSEALANLMAGIATGTAPAGTFIEGAGIGQQDFGLAGMLTKGETEQGVKAYLNVLIVDKNFNLLDGGFEAVGTESKEDGSGVPHQQLSSREFTITQPGYVYIWLSNEGEEPVEVYFDDFTVMHEHSKVIQADDYFPFGLTHGGSSYNAAERNKYLYNGKELQDDLGLDMYDYGARMYDAAIGRWHVVDSKADLAHNLTPYRYGFNNPVRYLDPDGNYETDGHFWTVYLAAILTRKNHGYDPYGLAYFAEAPDHVMNRRGDVQHATNTWLPFGKQNSFHALGGSSRYAEARRSRGMYRNATSLMDRGFALHRLGDSYAHSKSDNSMYSRPFGHANEMIADQIHNRPQLYLEYVRDVILTLGGNLSKIDMFTFNYVANSGNDTRGNMAVFEAEVRLREGVKTFSVQGDQANVLGSYFGDRNAHYEENVNYKTHVAEVETMKQNSDGEWVLIGKKETRTFVIY